MAPVIALGATAAYLLPRITARMDPACSMGPSLPMTRLEATANALPSTCMA